MNIAIPLGGQIRMVICSSFVIAKRKDTTHYDLSGESFQLTGVTADQVYVFDDSVVITEGMELTHNLIAQSLPLDRFVSVSAEEALPNAIGLLLRLAVADGRVTDSELLRIQPALEGRDKQVTFSIPVDAVQGLADGNYGGLCLYETPYNFGSSTYSNAYMRMSGTDTNYEPYIECVFSGSTAVG